MKEKKREKEELSFACFVGFKDSFFYRSCKDSCRSLKDSCLYGVIFWVGQSGKFAVSGCDALSV